MKRKYLQKITAVGALVAVSAAFAACGSKGAASSSASSVSASAVSETQSVSEAEPAEEAVSAASTAAPVSSADNDLDNISSSQSFSVAEAEKAFSFTDISWDFNVDSMKEALGEPASSDNEAYVYEGCDFNGHVGTAEFRFGDDGKLSTLTWTYVAPSTDDLKAVRTDVEAAANESYGEPVYQDEHLTDWVTDDYHVEVQEMLDQAPTLYYRIFTDEATENALN